MIPLTLEQRDYKERTLSQLQANLPALEAKLAQATQRHEIVSSHDQLKEVEAHIARLQKELSINMMMEPVADDLCRQVATALTKQKFYMAKRYLTKLETIEPFYPELDRLRQEAETEQVSRRTRSLAQGSAVPAAAEVSTAASSMIVFDPQAAGVRPAPVYRQKERRNWRDYLQFHYVASCLVLLVLMCAMASIGGMGILKWLIEGQ